MTTKEPKRVSRLVTAGVTLALLLAAGCDRAGDDAQAAAAGSAPTSPTPVSPSVPAAPPAAKVAAPAVLTGPPRIEFETLTYDFGRVPEISKHRGQISFTNTGGSPLVIEAIKATCGCTAVALEKRQYAPGETGTIEIVFDPVAPGEQRKYIDVKSNDASSPVTKITMLADVIGFIEIEPRMIKLESLRYGREHHTSVTISCPDPEFTLESVTTSNPHVTARVVGGSGGTRTVDLTVDPAAPWGGLFAWLTVTVTGRPTPDDATITHTSRARVQGSIFGDLVASPHTLRFGAAPGEVFERSLVLRRPDGASFRVLDARVTDTDLPTAAVHVEAGAGNAHTIVLTVTAPTRLARYEGTVEVTTDVPGEEELAIPITGVVRADPRGAG